jgi:hypothetical protein
MVQAWTVIEIRCRIASLALGARQFTNQPIFQSVLTLTPTEPSSG